MTNFNLFYFQKSENEFLKSELEELKQKYESDMNEKRKKFELDMLKQ